MFDGRISQFEDLPLPDHERKRTDILCLIIGPLFGLTMLVLALALLNPTHYLQSNYPTDSDWQACGQGPNVHYPFVYFPNITDISARVCVSVCPGPATSQLICRPNSVVTSCSLNSVYPSVVNFARLGGICTPQTPSGQATLVQTANLQAKWNFLFVFDSIRLALLVALGLGCLWLLLLQCLPRAIAGAVTLLGIAALVVLAVFCLGGSIGGASRVLTLLAGVLLLGTALLLGCFLCFYRLRNKLVSILLDWSTRFLRQEWTYFLLVVVFVALTVGLIMLCLLQHVAYVSHRTPSHQPNDIYLQLQPIYLLFALNLLEFVWGLQFLKDSFNFMLAGLAGQWYTDRELSAFQVAKRLLRYHFGSLVAGSFLNGFFNGVNFLLEAVRCYRDGVCPLCASAYEACCGCNRNFFELVRTDVYSYINLTGISYCDAARNSEYLIQNYHLFVGSQSLLYFYRISAYAFLVGTTVALTVLVQDNALQGQAYAVSLLFCALLSYCLLNYFVDCHPNVAEGLQTCFLIEDSLAPQAKKGAVVGTDPFDFKHEIHAMKKSYKDAVCC